MRVAPLLCGLKQKNRPGAIHLQEHWRGKGVMLDGLVLACTNAPLVSRDRQLASNLQIDGIALSLLDCGAARRVRDLDLDGAALAPLAG